MGLDQISGLAQIPGALVFWQYVLGVQQPPTLVTHHSFDNFKCCITASSMRNYYVLSSSVVLKVLPKPQRSSESILNEIVYIIPIISLKRNSFDASNNIIHLPTFLKMSFIIIVPCQLFGSVFYFKHFVRHSVWL